MTDTKHTDRVVAGSGAAPALEDWWASLLWPRLVGAVALGLRPGRVGLAFVGLAASSVLLGFGLQFDRWIGLGKIDVPLPAAVRALSDPSVVSSAAIDLPLALVRGMPITTLLMAPFALVLWTMLLGAISRLAALEFALGQFGTWHEGLNFAAARARSLAGIVLGPAIIVWSIALLLALGGWVGQWPGLNVVAAILLGLAMLLGLLAVVVVAVMAIVHGLCVAAVAADGADAIDAVQRGFAYLFSKPLRLLFYFFLAGIGVFLVAIVASWLLASTLDFTARGITAFMGPERARPFVEPLRPSLLANPDDLGTLGKATARIVAFWAGVAAMLVQAIVISGAMGAATAVYLAIRKACDGQDPADLYVPGAMEAAMADAAAARLLPGTAPTGGPIEGDA